MSKIWYLPLYSAPGSGAIRHLQSTRLKWLTFQVRIPIDLETVGKMAQYKAKFKTLLCAILSPHPVFIEPHLLHHSLAAADPALKSSWRLELKLTIINAIACYFSTRP